MVIIQFNYTVNNIRERVNLIDIFDDIIRFIVHGLENRSHIL